MHSSGLTKLVLTWFFVGLVGLNCRILEAGQSLDLKPEKNKLEVAIAATGPLYLPIFLANEAGYFAKRGVTVNISILSATASAQALLSGQVDIYQGGTAIIHANVAGTDLIYVAASVDRSTLVLFGQKGLTTFDSLRGKSVATTSVGAFGEIAVRKTAKEHGVEIGKDIKLLYHKGPPEALSTFLLGNADGVIVTPPQSEMARSKGFPVIVDYYERGLKIVGPGTGLARAFAQKNPNTLKIFLMGYLDGVKRAIDDPAYASKILAQSSKITDAKLLEDSYQEGVKVWNKDMTVDPEAIKVVLEQSTVPKAAELDPKRFFDNTLIREVNRDYAAKLFPGQVKY
ncbi:MAG: ABC transporter substrate-binding protein [Deltaproteobacteria bacterium]|nr:ABC transporter substrate-binding protein [Deltaproteobacteria bacterium]MBI2231300.1 ABC transporter substrate-binding protein [Deltaproteobacteria bacterium]